MEIEKKVIELYRSIRERGTNEEKEKVSEFIHHFSTLPLPFPLPFLLNYLCIRVYTSIPPI